MCPSADMGASATRNTILIGAVLDGYGAVNRAQFGQALPALEAPGARSPIGSATPRPQSPPSTRHPRRTAARDPGQRHRSVDRPARPVAMDGKDLRGASKQTEDGRRIDGQRRWNTTPPWSSGHGGRRPAVRDARQRKRLSQPGIKPSDAIAEHETARCLSRDSSNQANHPRGGSQGRFYDAPWRQNRSLGRKIAAAVPPSTSLSSPKNGYANLHGRRQAMRIGGRERDPLTPA